MIFLYFQAKKLSTKIKINRFGKKVEINFTLTGHCEIHSVKLYNRLSDEDAFKSNIFFIYHM